MKALEGNVWNLEEKGEHMEILSLYGWVLKMPAMKKFNLDGSENQSEESAVVATRVYHYCSYLRLPLLRSQTWTSQDFFSNRF